MEMITALNLVCGALKEEMHKSTQGIYNGAWHVVNAQ